MKATRPMHNLGQSLWLDNINRDVLVTGTRRKYIEEPQNRTGIAVGKQAPFTVNTTPENTLKAFGDHGKMSGVLLADGDDAETVLSQFTRGGIAG